MANVSKIKLPDNTTRDIIDSRISSVDSSLSASSNGVVTNSTITSEFAKVMYLGDASGSATYVDGDTVINVGTKADKVSNATNGNFASLDSSGNLVDSGHKHSDYQAALVSGTNIKTINNESLLGSGNITISGGSSDTSDCVHIAGAETIIGRKIFLDVQTFDDCSVNLDEGSTLHNVTFTDFSWLSTSNGSGGYKTIQSELDAKQATLVSGTNIKTINNQSLLGSGNITISGGGGGGDTSDCVHITGDETVGGDKTFTDDVIVGDASNIKYGASSGSAGFTKAITTDDKGDNVQTFVFSGLEGEPKAFIMTYGGSEYGVICVVGDSTGYHGVYSAASTRQHNYTSDFTVSYSNGSLSVTAPSGTIFADGTYSLVYYYGSGTLTFRTSQVAPGSGVTSVTFTGTGMTETPAMYACMLETQVNNESYRRVALYTNCFYGYDGNDDLVQEPLGVSFFSSQIHETTSSFSVSYNNGLYINSGGTNAGGYFHNPGTYTLYYLMASDIGGGGSGSYSSLADELAAINTTIGDIATILASI